MGVYFLRRGKAPATTVDVALSGNFNSSYGYVTIDGTKYTSAQTITVAKGTSVTVYCGSSSSKLQVKSTITLNGTTVAQGTFSTGAEYTFAVTDSCGVALERKSQNGTYYTAAITMPA